MSITVEELRARAQAWTAPVSEESPAGAVATFDPEYEKVRAEIAKRDSPSAGKVVWRTVIESGTDILQNKSKDLLIGSYVAFGLFTTRGLDGLVTGCAILTELIDTYWAGMFPEAKRIRGRVSALTWFIDAIGNSLPSVQVTGADRPAVEALAVASKRLSEIARSKFLDNTPAMRPLVDTAQQLLMSLPEEAPAPLPEAPQPPPPVAPPPSVVAAAPPMIALAPVAAPPPAPAPVASAAPVNLPAGPAAAPTDSAEVLNFVRGIGNTLADAANSLRNADISSPLAYRLMRVGIWLPIVEAPPVEGGKTRVPGPLPAAREQFEKIYQNGKWAALIEECESSLVRTRFWRDIQRYTAVALGNLGATHARARDEVIRETALLLKRFPDLPGFQFADGTAFADAETLTWITREVAGALGGGGGGGVSAGPVVVTVAGPSGGGDSGESAIADEARKLAGEGKVAEALAMLQSRVQGAGSAAARFRARLALGQVCLSAGQLGLARAVYEALERDVTTHGLEVWEPRLAASSAEGLLNCHRALAKGGKPLPTDSALLYDRLCRLDPTAALRLGA